MQTDTQLQTGPASLPLDPAVPATLLGVLDEPTVGADVLLPLVEFDANLTAGLLRVCNSCLFAGKREVGSVREALVRVGNLNFARIAFIVSLEPVFSREMHGYFMETDDLWRHSLATAYAASRLAASEGDARTSERTFTAGILHDLGKLALDETLRRKRGHEPGLADTDADVSLERRLLGVDHAEFGADQLEEWELPDEIVAAVRHHHDADAEAPLMSRAVRTGDRLVRLVAEQGDADVIAQELETFEAWGFDSALIKDIRSDVAQAGNDLLPVLVAQRH